MQQPVRGVFSKHSVSLRADLSMFTPESLAMVEKYHRTLPGYKPTPLVQLPALAMFLGVKDFRVKDESARLGLKAFKALGAAWAMAKHLGEVLGIADEDLSLSRIREEIDRQELPVVTFTTTTDGNHGRGVAWMARQLGQRAVINMPAGSTQERLQAIRNEGAEAEIVPMNYDDAVRLTARKANAAGWVVLQDTAWPGYEDIPVWIMQGYSTLIREAIDQYGDELPTHVVVPAGVGAFAGAIQAALSAQFGDTAPHVIVVESNQADCLYRSAQSEDGEAVAVGGSLTTIMAGLACGEANTIAWPILRDYSQAFLSCSDEISALGMRVLAAPLPGDPAVVSGESGAVTAGAIWWLTRSPEMKELATELGLGQDARVLVLSSEGDTDWSSYRQVVWGGLHPVASTEVFKQ